MSVRDSDRTPVPGEESPGAEDRDERDDPELLDPLADVAEEEWSEPSSTPEDDEDNAAAGPGGEPLGGEPAGDEDDEIERALALLDEGSRQAPAVEARVEAPAEEVPPRSDREGDSQQASATLELEAELPEPDAPPEVHAGTYIGLGPGTGDGQLDDGNGRRRAERGSSRASVQLSAAPPRNPSQPLRLPDIDLLQPFTPTGTEPARSESADLPQRALDWEGDAAAHEDPERAAVLLYEAARLQERAAATAEAERLYAAAQAADPTFLPAIERRRRLVVRRGDFLAAERLVTSGEEALCLPAERAALRALRADLLLASGKAEEAARVGDSAGTELTFRLLVAEARATEEAQVAASALDAAANASREPALSAGLLFLAGAKSEESDVRAAARRYALAAATPCETAAALAARLGAARLCLRIGQRDDAADQLESLKKWTEAAPPLQAGLRLRAALHRLVASGPVAALTVLPSAGDAGSEIAERRARLLLELGRRDEARTYLGYVVSSAPDVDRQVDAALSEAALSLEVDAAASAIQAIETALSLAPGDVSASVLLRLAYARSGASTKAAEIRRAAPEPDPFGAALLARWGNAEPRPVNALALADLDHALSRNPANLPALWLFAVAAEPARLSERLMRAGESVADPDVGVALTARALALADVNASAPLPAGLRERPSPRGAVAIEQRAINHHSEPMWAEAFAAHASSVGEREVAAAFWAASADALVEGEGHAAALAQAGALVAGEPRTHLLGALAAACINDNAALANRFKAASAASGEWGARVLALVAAEILDPALSGSSGNAEASLAEYRAAALVGDDDAMPIVRRLARILGRESELVESLERAALSSRGDSERIRLLLRAAETAMRMRQPVAASRILEDVAARHPDDVIIRETHRQALREASAWPQLAENILAELSALGDADTERRVAAYQALATIDIEGRGDLPSAVLALESLLLVDPGHQPTLRFLERYYLRERRWEELLTVWSRLAQTLTTREDRVPVLMRRARLCEQTERPTLEARTDRRAVLAVAPAYRPALLRELSLALDAGEQEVAADLYGKLAETAGEDGRGRAVLLTRQGELLSECGSPERAAACFAAAVAAFADYLPAQLELRRLALSGSRFAEAVDALLGEAASSRLQDARVAALLAAGEIAEHELDDPASAITSYRRALETSPDRWDAFVRLHAILSAQGRNDELAQLLRARIAVDADEERAISLRFELAGLLRNHLSDLSGARAELEAILERRPRHKAALALLADVANEAGDPEATAETLERQVEVERDPARLRDARLRLGRLYAGPVPDPQKGIRALTGVLAGEPRNREALALIAELHERNDDPPSALASLLRLADAETSGPRRVEVLQRAARLLEASMGDLRRAEELLRRAVEVMPLDVSAIDSLADFYERRQSASSLRVHLDGSAARLRSQLMRDPADIAAYRSLRRVFERRRQPDAFACTSQVIASLGVLEPEEAASSLPVSAARGADLLASEAMDMLAPAAVPSGARHLLRLVSEAIARRFPIEPRTLGVGRGDRITRDDHPAREVAQAVAREFAVASFDLYLSRPQATLAIIEPASTPWIVVGMGLVEGASAAELRFLFARLFFLHAVGLGVPLRLSNDDLGLFLVAAVRQHVPDFFSAQVSLGAAMEEAQRLARALPRRTLTDLMPFALEMSGFGVEPDKLKAGIGQLGDRAALLCSGDVGASVRVLRRMAGLAVSPAPDVASDEARTRSDVAELMRFALSEDHLALRRQLGIGAA